MFQLEPISLFFTMTDRHITRARTLCQYENVNLHMICSTGTIVLVHILICQTREQIYCTGILEYKYHVTGTPYCIVRKPTVYLRLMYSPSATVQYSGNKCVFYTPKM
jgi:hypothetical protein